MSKDASASRLGDIPTVNLHPHLRIVLVFTDPPLPFGMAAARWYYVLLKGLRERGYAVTAYAPCATVALAEEAAKLFPRPAYDLRCFQYPQRGGWRAKWETMRAPYSYIFGPDLKADLERTLSDGDCILHLETQWSGWLGLKHRERAVVNVLSLYAMDLAGAPSNSWWDAACRRWVLGAEKRLLRAYPHLLTLSAELARHLIRIQPTVKPQVIAFGFDASLYEFAPPTRGVDARPVVGLIGSFHWQPTYTAGVRLLTRLWPEIRRRVPDARLLIVGRQARSALAAFLPTEQDPSITVEENVPDTLPYFRQLDAMLYAPAHGTGVKVKVLEAFALGVPVVTNRAGVEGIPAIDGVHVGIAEEDQHLVERCVDLLKRPADSMPVVFAARQLLESHCGPNTVLDQWQRVYNQIEPQKTSPVPMPLSNL